MFKRIETTPIFLLLHIAIMVSSPARAQWLNQPSLGIPRLANGKPNLTAPAPRTSYGKPDLSGLWRASPNNSYGLNIVVDLKAEDTQRSARALYDQRLEDLGKAPRVSVSAVRTARYHFPGNVKGASDSGTHHDPFRRPHVSPDLSGWP